MKKETIRKLVLSAMFAALCCVATLVVQIPIATGYLNAGEGMCLLSGLVLGPWCGMAAAGLGSAAADRWRATAFMCPRRSSSRRSLR